MALLRFSFTVGIYTLASRVLGFARDILIARYLGSTGVVEAFVVALRFPNLFRRLVGEGAFTAAFVPMFSRRLEAEGRPAALRFAMRTAQLPRTPTLLRASMVSRPLGRPANPDRDGDAPPRLEAPPQRWLRYVLCALCLALVTCHP